MSAPLKDRNYVISVLLRFLIENKRRKAEDAKCGRRKNSAFETRCRAVMQNTFRRTRGVTKIIRQPVQEALHAGRRFQCAEFAQL
jgi:hypothetical protein